MLELRGRVVQRAVSLDKDGNLQDAESRYGHVGVDSHLFARLQVEDEHAGETVEGGHLIFDGVLQNAHIPLRRGFLDQGHIGPSVFGIIEG